MIFLLVSVSVQTDFQPTFREMQRIMINTVLNDI